MAWIVFFLCFFKLRLLPRKQSSSYWLSPGRIRIGTLRSMYIYANVQLLRIVYTRIRTSCFGYWGKCNTRLDYESSLVVVRSTRYCISDEWPSVQMLRTCGQYYREQDGLSLSTPSRSMDFASRRSIDGQAHLVTPLLIFSSLTVVWSFMPSLETSDQPYFHNEWSQISTSSIYVF